jgi:hypothetical protein
MVAAWQINGDHDKSLDQNLRFHRRFKNVEFVPSVPVFHRRFKNVECVPSAPVFPYSFSSSTASRSRR